jgi:hypothetical protein
MAGRRTATDSKAGRDLMLSHPAKPNPVSAVELRFLSPVGGYLSRCMSEHKPPVVGPETVSVDVE